MENSGAAIHAAVEGGGTAAANQQQPLRSPPHELHGRYSQVKMQAAFDIYVDCTHSLEGVAKALALAHVFWFGEAPEKEALVVPSTISLWVLTVGHLWWHRQNSHIRDCLSRWKGSYNTDGSARGKIDHHLRLMWNSFCTRYGTCLLASHWDPSRGANHF